MKAYEIKPLRFFTQLGNVIDAQEMMGEFIS